jgi:hypothetical protein
VNAALPQGFAQLAPLVEGWALPTSALRAERRSTSSPAERAAFHDAVEPLLEEALAWLDRQRLDALDEAGTNLMNLCLMMAHIALAVETQGDNEPHHAPHRDAMRITRTPADA